MQIEITIDRTRCQGHARCLALAPDLFDLDDEGLAVVIGRAEDDAALAAARNAQLNCPEDAITIAQ